MHNECRRSCSTPPNPYVSCNHPPPVSKCRAAPTDTFFLSLAPAPSCLSFFLDGLRLSLSLSTIVCFVSPRDGLISVPCFVLWSTSVFVPSPEIERRSDTYHGGLRYPGCSRGTGQAVAKRTTRRRRVETIRTHGTVALFHSTG